MCGDVESMLLPGDSLSIHPIFSEFTLLLPGHYVKRDVIHKTGNRNA